MNVEEEPQELEFTEEEKMLDASYRVVVKLKRDPSLLLGGTSVTTTTNSIPTGSPPSSTTNTTTTNTTTNTAANTLDSSAPKRPKVLKVVNPISMSLPEQILLDYDAKYDLSVKEWDSSKDPPLIQKLENVDPTLIRNETTKEFEIDTTKKNTLVIWATMPLESEKFSFHIALSESYKPTDPDTTFIYHLQARDRPKLNKQSIIQNSLVNKTWSADVDRSIKGFPIEKNKPFQLRFTFCPQGIAVYLDGRLVTEFQYRYGAISSGSTLYLIVTNKDEQYHDVERVNIHRVWWGYAIPHVPGTNKKKIAFASLEKAVSASFNRPQSSIMEDAPADRALFIAGLPKDGSAETELSRIFEHYQVDTVNGRLCLSVDTSKGQGVVKLQNARNVETAIKYLNNIRTLFGGTLVVIPAKRKQVPVWFES